MNHNSLPSGEAAANLFAHKLVARLSAGTSELPYEITERLRASRVQALARRKRPVTVVRTAPAILHAGSSAVLGSGPQEHLRWWQSLLSAVPIMALLAGLVVINLSLDEIDDLEVAEVDAALLADDLPPAAYSDPGFVQFLKTGAPQNN